MSEYKRCSRCGQELPATSVYFSPRKANVDGLEGRCRDCDKKRAREWRVANPEKVKDANQKRYARDPDYSNRWRKANPERVKEIRQKSDEKNRDKIKQRKRLWRKSNPDKVAAEKKRSRERNRENERKRLKRWYIANRERQRKYAKESYEANKPARIKQAMLNTQRRMARKKKLPDTLTAVEWQHTLDYFGGCCAVCGSPPGFFHTIAMDHWIPLTSPDCPGTVAGNMIPLCHGDYGCNNSKGNRNAHDWLLSRFGPRRASEIETRIAVYFDSIAKQA